MARSKVLSAEDATQLREDRAAGTALRILADKYGVSIGTACNVARGLAYLNVGGPITRRRPKATNIKGRVAEYNSWKAMITRCYNPKHNHFDRYGGRSPPVTVCAAWRESFDVFCEYMGPRPTGCNGGVDRWPNEDGNYEQGNVRWSTQEDQMRNRRDNRYVVYEGKRVLLRELVGDTGLSYHALYYRIRTKGMDAARAVSALGGGENGL